MAVLASLSWVSPQIVANGVVAGLVVGLLAMGVVLVYRATGVINFAVANIGVIGATLFAVLVVRYHVPFWLALALSLAVGMAVAGLAELAVIRRLFRAPRVIVLVATIGIAQLALAISTALPSLGDYSAAYPVVSRGSLSLGGMTLSGAQLSIVVAVPLVALGLGWFLNRTTVGKSVQAAADNADLASLSGVHPKNVSTLTWVIAGLLGTLAIVLVAGQGQQASQLTVLGPDTLAGALVAAVVGGLRSFPRAMAAGVVIGVAQALLEYNFVTQTGLVDALLLVGVVVVVWIQGNRPGTDPGNAYPSAPKSRPLPTLAAARWWMRHLGTTGFVALVAGAVVLPLIVTQPSKVLLYATVLAYVICASSLTVLTGWSGLLSLGQMAFAGIGALAAAQLTTGMHLDWRIGGAQVLHFSLHPIPFWVSVPIAAALGAVLATVVGAGALRAKGVLLAVTTFAFALAAQNYLYRLPPFSGGQTESVSFTRGGLFGLDTTSQRTYYYIVLAVAVVVLATLFRLRRSGVGRTLIGVRDNAPAAASYTISPTATRLKSFALAGAIAGLGGALLAGVVETFAYEQQYFTVNDSLVLVAIVVIGGLGSVSGALLGALWVVGLPAFFPGNTLVPLLTSSIGLLVVLLYFPGGMAQVGDSLRRWFADHLERRHPPEHAKKTTSPPPAVLRIRAPEGQEDRGPALSAKGMTVRFGGIGVLDRVSIEVAPGELVGLIGANGAGKSTLLNAIGGYVPAEGRVVLLGHQVDGASIARRARLGLGRTFQSAALFPELTVRETVELALEARGHTGLVATALATPGWRRRHRAQQGDGAELVDFMGLGRYASHQVAELSTGTRRIVELAALLAVGSQVLCMDEPTAGVAQKEAEAFGPLISSVRAHLGASIVVVEHDMSLLMGLSDRLYCLEAGSVIAEGPPSHIRRHPRVIQSYLGTDRRLVGGDELASVQG